MHLSSLLSILVMIYCLNACVLTGNCIYDAFHLLIYMKNSAIFLILETIVDPFYLSIVKKKVCLGRDRNVSGYAALYLN